MSTISLAPLTSDQPLDLPSRGRVGMLSLIIGESAIFTIFVVAYVFYIGKSLYGPTPAQVLEVPIFNTVCLLSSSFFIWLAERSIEKNRMRRFLLWWSITICLGIVFLVGTARRMAEAHLSRWADHPDQSFRNHLLFARWTARYSRSGWAADAPACPRLHPHRSR